MNPFELLIVHCLDMALTEFFSGRMSMEEAIDYGVKLTDKYAETEEFSNIVEEYFEQFADVKEVQWGKEN